MLVTSTKSTFTWAIEDEFIVIIDQDGRVSVTNDVENVIGYIRAEGVDVDAHQIIYRDSAGEWDGLLTRDGKFRAWRFLRGHSKEQAKARWRAHP